uniref:Uncharacterized protein n=1 Tax=Molossus molossus TaxID=27622 RepID=A0A7J8JVU4_MOLMO|nr:hypothetical protein HJG59_008025 [Molossus molossus]
MGDPGNSNEKRHNTKRKKRYTASRHSECHGGSSNREQTASPSRRRSVGLCAYCLEGSSFQKGPDSGAIPMLRAREPQPQALAKAPGPGSTVGRGSSPSLLSLCAFHAPSLMECNITCSPIPFKFIILSFSSVL